LDALRQLKRKRWKENANKREKWAFVIKEAKVFRGQQILLLGCNAMQSGLPRY
jgi:hypothetical protein